MTDPLPPRPTGRVALLEQNAWLRRTLASLQAAYARLQQEQTRRMREMAAHKQEIARLQRLNQTLRTGNRSSLARVLQDAEERAAAAEQQVQTLQRQVITLEREIQRLHDTLTQTHGLLRAIPRGQQSPDVQRALGRLRAAVPCLEGNDG